MKTVVEKDGKLYVTNKYGQVFNDVDIEVHPDCFDNFKYYINKELPICNWRSAT